MGYVDKTHNGTTKSSLPGRCVVPVARLNASGFFSSKDVLVDGLKGSVNHDDGHIHQGGIYWYGRLILHQVPSSQEILLHLWDESGLGL